MVHAVIMIRTETGTSADVKNDLQGIGAIGDVHVVAGDFDVVAEVDAGEVYDVLQTASAEIQATDGVVETKTYVSLT